MRILVCVKQSGQEINPFDLYALRAAAALRDQKRDVSITAISMGDDKADSALRDSLAISADRAFHIKDCAFGGADVRMTAMVLARAIEYLEEREGRFQMILCGDKSVDSGTYALPPYLSGLLDRPYVGSALDCSFAGDPSDFPEEVNVEKQWDEGGNIIYRAAFPCVISFTKNSSDPEYPLIERIIEASGTDIPILTAPELYHGAALPRPLIEKAALIPRSAGRKSVMLKDDREGIIEAASRILKVREGI